MEAEEAERRMHSDKASKKSILSHGPEVRQVDAVYAVRHVKLVSPDSLIISYRCGMSMFKEWICLDHDGYAYRTAMGWWNQRFGVGKKKATVNDALEDMFLTQTLLDWTKTITVKKNGQHFEIIDYNTPLGVTE